MDSNDFALGMLAGQDSGGGNSGGKGSGGFWGSEGLWAVIILAIIFGWGGNGFGGFGGGSGGASGALTRADLAQGFNFQDLNNAVRGIQNGLSDGFYAMNTGLMNGFHGVDSAICNLGFTTQQGFSATQLAMLQGQNALQAQLAQCCCDNRAGQKDIQYQMATDTCATNTNINQLGQTLNNTIRDGFAAMERREDARYIAELERKLNICDRDSALQGMSSYLINTLRPSPIPAYPSCNPWASCGGNWSGCNCGC